jgi:hypothetical protein
MKTIHVALGTLVLAMSATGQTGSIRSLLDGTKYPREITAAQAKADYMPVQISALESGVGSMMSLMMMGMMGAGGAGQAFPQTYTKGETVTIAGKTFLVAYTAPVDVAGMMGQAMLGAMEEGMAGEDEGDGQEGDQEPEPGAVPQGPQEPENYMLTFYNLELIVSISPWPEAPKDLARS